MLKEKKQKTIGLLFGGRSNEFEVSLKSALALAQTFQYQEQHLLKLIAIQPQTGEWISHEGVFYPEETSSLSLKHLYSLVEKKQILGQKTLPASESLFQMLNGIFPIIHGADGEDGKVQGFLSFHSIPFVGCQLDTSALCFQKAWCKNTAQKLGIPVLEDRFLRKTDQEENLQRNFFQELQSSTLFIKPVRGGSSLGISRVSEKKDLLQAISKAFKEDSMLLIEPEIKAQEVFCAFYEPGFKNSNRTISVLGSLETDFFDYDQKYLHPKVKPQIPAPIPQDQTNRIQKYANQLAHYLEIKHLARLDFWYQNDTKQIFFNEINTMPGLTNQSLYPLLLQQEGLLFEKWIHDLIDFTLREKNESL